jgi:hypothetical protein
VHLNRNDLWLKTEINDEERRNLYEQWSSIKPSFSPGPFARMIGCGSVWRNSGGGGGNNSWLFRDRLKREDFFAVDVHNGVTENFEMISKKFDSSFYYHSDWVSMDFEWIYPLLWVNLQFDKQKKKNNDQ